MSREITDEKIDRYLALTTRAIEKCRIAAPAPSHLEKVARDYMTMAKSYLSDARHFKEAGDYVNAFAAVNYAHGWLDAGARLGVFDVDRDDVLFTLQR